MIMSEPGRLEAVYAWQAVDDKDAISIENQIEISRVALNGNAVREYIDRVLSYRNAGRPSFQQLVKDVKAGQISRVAVYKIGRISRSIVDFADMIALFKEHNVEFISVSEKINTGAPEWEAISNVCNIFAQMERENTVSMATDVFYSKVREGLHMTGPAPYGYVLEPYTINGIESKRFAIKPDEAERILLMFEMYSVPHVSYGDITRYFAERGIRFYGKSLIRSTLAKFLRNPVYVRADLSIYEFFKSQGAEIVNDPDDFTGTNGCYLYREKGKPTAILMNEINGCVLVIAPHEGIVPSETWLKCRLKLMANITYPGNRKAKHTWLAGKIKCGLCGYSMSVAYRKSYPTKYLRCSTSMNDKSCPGPGTTRLTDVEASVFEEMVKKLKEFDKLTDKEKTVRYSKLTDAQEELAIVQEEVTHLINSMTGATSLLISYANERIGMLDARQQELVKMVAELSVNALSPEKVELALSCLDDWENTEYETKRQVADLLIVRVTIIDENVEIEWKI